MSAEGNSFGVRACWWACGVDTAIINDVNCPASERVRFAALGLFIWLAAVGGFVAGHMIAADTLLPAQDGVLRALFRQVMLLIAAGFLGALVLNLLRLAVGLAGRRTDRVDLLSLDAVRAATMLIVTGMLALAVAAPFQIALVERDVQSAILMDEQVGILERARVMDVGQLDAAELVPPAERIARFSAERQASGFFRKAGFAYATNAALCVSVLIAVWLLFALPPVIRLLTDRGAYDFLVLHRNREILAAAGIEPERFTLYAPDGTPRLMDAFHVARRVHAESLDAVLKPHNRDVEALGARHRAGPDRV